MDLTKKRKLEENGVVSADPAGEAPTRLSLDDAQKILESFTHEQLFEIVRNAVVLGSAGVLDAVRSIADRDPAQRKLFVRGLGWETTSEKLRSLFSAYGDLAEAIVILDKVTGKSKGYGFVTFAHVDGAILALKEPSKTIDGRVTVAQLAASGSSGGAAANPPPAEQVSGRKIYVANVPYEMPADRLLSHFSAYGEIEEGPVGYDKATGRSKGYALFVYKTVEAARASLVDPIKVIDGKSLNCKIANDGMKGKVMTPVGPAGVQAVPGPNGVVPVEAGHGNGFGVQAQPSSMQQGSLASQYGGPVVPPGGISAYGGFSGGGMPPSSLGGGGGYGSGLGGPFSGGHFGGPGSTGYGGLGGGGGGGLGGAGSGLGGGQGGAGNGFGGTGGGLGPSGGGLGVGGRGGSSFYRLPPSSGGGFPEAAHYSLSSSAYGSQHHQPSGTSPAPRVPHGGMYQGMPHYY